MQFIQGKKPSGPTAGDEDEDDEDEEDEDILGSQEETSPKPKKKKSATTTTGKPKRRKKKDPNRPSKPLSSFMHFMAEQRQDIKEKNPVGGIVEEANEDSQPVIRYTAE